MNTLTIKKLQTEEAIPTSEQLENLLEKQCDSVTIGQVNWAEYPYKPEVQFRIAHTGQEIILKFYVHEKNILAQVTELNGPVHTDSCAEFFFSPISDGFYYNFEFNCIGTPHVAYGNGRGNRSKLSPDVLQKIEAKSSLGTQAFSLKEGDFSWEMFVRIPIECLIHHPIYNLSGMKSKANFYKCGDNLAEAYFLSWNPIGTENPDFHRPEYFGDIYFE